MVNISIHAPAWGATHQLQHQVALLCISIHALAWGATSAGVGRSAQTSYFNPRTRVGCDMVLSCALQSQGFQSTHPRGVRLRFCRNAFLHSRFQSTHPRGVRPFLLRNLFRRFNISIHAPAWGATLPDLPNAYPILHFNPRTRVGCDYFYSGRKAFRISFQSTHPRGVRQINRAKISDPIYFNPRTRVGCDRPAGFQIYQHLNFNPRTRVGCD
mgnify:CR=1 FL=1